MDNVSTILEATVRLAKNQLRQNAGSMEQTEVISCAALLEEWKPGSFAVGDVVKHNGQPWKCVQAHDSTRNPDWQPGAAASLWSPYHSKSPAWALDWVQPTGAQDAYQQGEYMVWTDGSLYRCKQDNTVWSPEELPTAWENQEAEK